MNVKETIVIAFDEQEKDALNNVGSILIKLIEKMNERNMETINDSDNFGYSYERKDIVRAEEIISFLLSDELFTLN